MAESAEKLWYVLHTYSGYENKVKANLESRVTSMNMEDYIFQVIVPEEEEHEKKRTARTRSRWKRFSPATCWSKWS